MIDSHDTATECADAFERMAKSMAEYWRRILNIPSNADPTATTLDRTGSLAASASANVLAAGDSARETIVGLRAAARKLRAIGQGAAVVDEWPDIPTAQPITRPLADTTNLERFARGEIDIG